jgi:hypothetical protein
VSRELTGENPPTQEDVDAASALLDAEDIGDDPGGDKFGWDEGDIEIADLDKGATDE